jgi:hypothetical protein
LDVNANRLARISGAYDENVQKGFHYVDVYARQNPDKDTNASRVSREL